MNQLIMNGMQEGRENVEILENLNESQKSDLVLKYESTLSEIENSKRFLLKVKNEIDESFDKLKSILESRNELSNILKEFNNATKTIMNDKEKILKLKQSIEKIYKMYDETNSIEAFFESTKEDCIEKIRFTSDYEEIENGINFFTLNTSYVESDHYLNTYNMLKRIAITRYYNYMASSLQSFFNLFEGITINDDFFNLNLNFISKNMNRKFYNFPKNFEKMRSIQNFFEGKSQYDYEVKKIIEAIKQKFIDQRTNMLKPFYEEIVADINKSDSEGKVFYSSLCEISKMTIAEILFFSNIFQTKASDNTYILQKLTSDIYNSLYNNLRPIIISSESLDELFSLFDSFSDNFGIFFLEVNETNQEEVNSRIISFYLHLISQSKITFDETETLGILNSNVEKITNIVKISKILIRPTILKIVQDIQEKIFFKINIHLKTNLIDLENDFQNMSVYEEKISHSYKHFHLFHFFLRRLAIVLEVLRNKLDKQVLNELTVSAIEKFLSILNEEIVNKKNLTYDFEVYIIQQVLLAMKLLEEFGVEAIESGVDIDFYSITDIFRNNLNIKDILINSAPKLYDKTRDFRKILYNNLLKSHKILLNLVNELVFGREVMDIIYKIRNKEAIDEKLLNTRLIEKREVFLDIISNFEKIIKEMNNQLRMIDTKINDKLTSSIIENICNILSQLRSLLIGKEGNYNELLHLLDKDVVRQNLFEIRNNIIDN